MWETIAMWGGVAGLFVSIFAVIIIYLTRKNILDILDKDVILFDRNFELKKQAITEAYSIVDEIIESEGKVKSNPNFKDKAKNCYNELLCVVSDIKVADEFYSIALENVEFSQVRLAHFKIMCRQDIGLKTKKAMAIKRASNKHANSNKIETRPMDTVNAQTDLPPRPAEDIRVARPISAQSNINAPINSGINQTAPIRTNIEPNQSRPASQPISQPANNVSPSTAEPVRRPGRPPINRPTSVSTNNQVRRPFPTGEGNQ